MSETYLYIGPCADILSRFEADIVDSIVCDPPYGLKFMNAKWDYSIPTVEDWKAHWQVLKPGGYLLAFAGTRTQHRMACNIEDAGFEIRDSIAWMYGQGMPKSGGLKPAHEPIIVARKPGKGAKLNIDECRVQASAADRATVDGRVRVRDGSSRTNYGEFARDSANEVMSLPEGGRYPANIIHDGSDVVTALFPTNNPGCKPHRVKASAETVDRLQAKGWGFSGCDKVTGYDDGDDLSAARFFYCAKANKTDRNEGAEGGNTHLTVKPTELMRYLVRLVTPEGGLVLDGFMGSGSTGKAAVLEGRDFVGIDIDPANVELAAQRIEFARSKCSE